MNLDLVDNIPLELRSFDQWVLCQFVQRKGKLTKLPINARAGDLAKTDDPATWSTYAEALEGLKRFPQCKCLGFIFSANDPFAGIDKDDCIDEAGNLSDEARVIVDSVYTYWEKSQSGRGIKSIARGKLPPRPARRRNASIEMYDDRRFFALTGDRLPGAAATINDCQEEITRLHAQLLPAKKQTTTNGSRVSAPLALDDRALLEKASRARNGARFDQLWRGEWKGNYHSQSEADGALCADLAFWFQRDAAAIDRMFRQSGLMRDKWERDDYRASTIDGAIGLSDNIYTPGAERPPEYTDADDPEGGRAKPSVTQVEVNGQTEEKPPHPAEGPVNAENSKPARVSQATRLVELALLDGVELFHDGEGGFVSFAVDDHEETHPLKAGAFRRHLIDLYYRTEAERAPGSQALQEALDTLEARAFRHGKRHAVFTRLAEHDGAIYLDLVNDDWEVVIIDRDGWEISKERPVKFRRKSGMLPLPRPTEGGDITTLWNFVNIENKADRVLFVADLLAALRPSGPYPVTGFHGEQGSAKSTTARVFRDLVDPNKAALRDNPDQARDLMIAATNSWMVCFDNLSGIPVWLSDCLCRLSTGAGFGVRKNYTDDEEMLFVACRPIVMTGIAETATRPDLLDRSLLFTLPAIPENKRRDEKGFWSDFEEAKAGILGALLDALAAAVQNLPTTKIEQLPRMADFALWATAAEPGLGWKPGTFMEAYTANRAEANSIALEASAIGDLVRDLVREWGEWTGKATDLLKLLTEMVGESVLRRKDWPKSARTLSAALKAITPNLRAAGVGVSFRTSGGRWIDLIPLVPFPPYPDAEPTEESARVRKSPQVADSEPVLRTLLEPQESAESAESANHARSSGKCVEKGEEEPKTALESEKRAGEAQPETERDFADSADSADSWSLETVPSANGNGSNGFHPDLSADEKMLMAGYLLCERCGQYRPKDEVVPDEEARPVCEDTDRCERSRAALGTGRGT